MLVRALLLVAMELVLLWELHLTTELPSTRTGDFQQQQAVRLSCTAMILSALPSESVSYLPALISSSGPSTTNAPSSVIDSDVPYVSTSSAPSLYLLMLPVPLHLRNQLCLVRIVRARRMQTVARHLLRLSIGLKRTLNTEFFFTMHSGNFARTEGQRQNRFLIKSNRMSESSYTKKITITLMKALLRLQSLLD